MTTAELIAVMRAEAVYLGVDPAVYDNYDPAEPECPEFCRLLEAARAALLRRRKPQ